MRVLVVDDQWIVESAVARALAPAGHVVVGVRSPEDLAARFAGDDRDFQLAFVDLDFQKESERSGLAALEECGKVGVPAALLTADGEHNRILHLLAAFEFYPDTLTLVSKNGAEKDIRDIATAVAYGHRPNPEASADFRPPRRGPSWINSLVRQPGHLALWRAAAVCDRHATIIEETRVGARSLSTFLEQSAEAVQGLQQEFFGVASPEDEPGAGTRKKHLQVVTAFAQTYAWFFGDQDVERLVNEMWGTEGRQEGQGRAAGVARRRKFRTGKRV
ncbi:response regulator [Streptomyces sp. NBC_00503]|uniref:response regulator n=1 Tax=Streptomyces sp. NBC_00503 TaxID=2903659 RepID=UPI002E805B27|nr:response regulator [Streptomyces sp. NBC_00503]WUD85397.1 response regulator [Streptomyces sp. NBC_00503]